MENKIVKTIESSEMVLQQIYMKMITINQDSNTKIFTDEEIELIRKIDKIT
jgi:hypothetical protein